MWKKVLGAIVVFICIAIAAVECDAYQKCVMRGGEFDSDKMACDHDGKAVDLGD